MSIQTPKMQGLIYEDSVPLSLQLTFFSAFYCKVEETEEEAGPVRLRSLKTGKSLKLPFVMMEDIALKFPAAVDRANAVKAPSENNVLIYEDEFKVNEEFFISLQVTSYSDRNFVFLKPKRFKKDEGRFIYQSGKSMICSYLFS